MNDMKLALTAALQGTGLAFVIRQIATAEMHAGRRNVVLERFCPVEDGFHLYYPGRAQMPGKLRAFIEFLRAANWQVPG